MTGKDLDKLLQEDRRKRAKQAGKTGPAPIPTGPKSGVQKRKPTRQAPASLTGKWTHDLHASVANPTKHKTLHSAAASTGAKIPIVLKPGVAEKLSRNRLFKALHGMAGGGEVEKKVAADLGINIRGASKAGGTGITIKGSAGPFAVHGSNFAPGTTASDIRNVMETRQFKLVNCGILSAKPTVIAEIVFEKQEDAQRCIEEFNNRLADGRLLHFMLKESPQLRIPPKARNAAQEQLMSQPVAQNSAAGPVRSEQSLTNVVDGKFGFTEPRSTRGGLYSDSLVSRGRGNRR
ncbi:hypothetical protein TWF696_005109 [Orbilia brochopaga]|uniref:Btz domain-containing protein n=1 Tax=Orbilia brochopaga TaxID=3140254 RepID=A0AAV9V0Y8_9PEZI